MADNIKPLGEPQLLAINSIKPAPNNPRKIPPRAVEITAKSIKRFGWQQPIIVDTNHVIIAGHTRTEAAKSLGLTKIPAIIADNLTPEEAHAYRIADNRTSDFTTWDFPELTKQLEELSDNYAEELALDDWQGIIEEFEQREEAGDLADIDLDERSEAQLTMEHTLSVVCESEEAMRNLEGELAEREEVIDVRHKR